MFSTFRSVPTVILHARTHTHTHTDTHTHTAYALIVFTVLNGIIWIMEILKYEVYTMIDCRHPPGQDLADHILIV